jgi:hypothetical protein
MNRRQFLAGSALGLGAALASRSARSADADGEVL